MFGAHMRGPDIPDARAEDALAVARRILSYVGPYWRTLVVALIAGVVAAASGAVGPWLVGLAIDRYIANGISDGLATVMLYLFVSFVVGLLSRMVQFRLMGNVAQRSLAAMRVSIFTAIERQSLRFFDKHESGDLMSRLVNDIEAINNILAQGFVQAFGSGLGLIGVIVAMLLLDWRLAVVSFLVLPAMFITTSFFSRWARREFRKTRKTIGDVSANLQEDIAGIRVAQAFNRTNVNRARFAERNAANRDANVGATAVTSAFFPAMEVLGALATGIVAGFGGYLVLQDQLTVGVVVAFLGYVQQFFWPIQQIGQLFTLAQSAMAAGERIFGLIDEPVEVADRAGSAPSPRLVGRVEFDDVTFGYDREHPVLENVSFVAQPGQTVALVGPTGAGKTTVINLLARFYDVDSGRVLLDGVDVREPTMDSIRTQMGIVPQNSFLFAGTIGDNIRYGRLEATDAEVEDAARAVNAHGFISLLPDGYATKIGERGGTLSQGQRQLIAFARAILADPRILILDEATSSVDTRTELLIQQALATLLTGRTSFVIAHRLSTVRNADQVLVIDEGRIVERGTHHELLQAEGVYAQLYRRQFRDTPVEAVA